ncbi:hypothetical protein [Xenorhabdus sp. SGI246]
MNNKVHLLNPILHHENLRRESRSSEDQSDGLASIQGHDSNS